MEYKSKKVKMSEIKLGDKVITQELFNEIYDNYQDLLLREDVDNWWNEQYMMAEKERQLLKEEKQELLDRLNDKWISVKDRLPDNDVSVLLYTEYDGVCVGYRVSDDPPMSFGVELPEYERDYMILGYTAEIRSGVTYWQPLPNHPGEQTTD